jgi:hypothetical protein
MLQGHGKLSRGAKVNKKQRKTGPVLAVLFVPPTFTNPFFRWFNSSQILLWFSLSFIHPSQQYFIHLECSSLHWTSKEILSCDLKFLQNRFVSKNSIPEVSNYSHLEKRTTFRKTYMKWSKGSWNTQALHMLNKLSAMPMSMLLHDKCPSRSGANFLWFLSLMQLLEIS